MNLLNLRKDTRFHIFGNSTNTDYEDTDLDRNLNLWYKRVISWIIEANGEWQVKGEIATTDIVANQREYILPLDKIKINELYIMYGGIYYKAKQRDTKELTGEPDQATYGYYPSEPEFDIIDNSIMIYLPSATIPATTAGLKIHYQTTTTDLAATNDEPDISEPYDRILAYGAAYDYCEANKIYDKAASLAKKIGIDQPIVDSGLKKELKNFYAGRSTVKPAKLEFRENNYY